VAKRGGGGRRPATRETAPVLPPIDLVLLRNVPIYFDLSTKQQILARIRQVLQPDGYLLPGGAETTHNLDDGFLPDPFAEGGLFRVRPPQEHHPDGPGGSFR
jgi:chemotaxis methyl-accepting protein methylase